MRKRVIGDLLESPFKLFNAMVVEPWVWPPKPEKGKKPRRGKWPNQDVGAYLHGKMKAMEREHRKEIRYYKKKLRESEKRLKNRR